MKKILTLLTGIVFLITILAAGGCRNGNKQNEAILVENDSTRVVYLKDTLIDGRMHLEMYNEKHPDKKEIDTLTTDVRPGYTVIWKHAHKSKIKKVNHIRPLNLIKENGKIFSKEAEEVESKSLYTYEIPSTAKPGKEKYEIIFKDKNDDFWCIDPYLRIPDD